MQKRLYKSTRNVMMCGVCGGLAEYLNLDPSLIRILWVILSLASIGIGIIAYIACALILPKDIDIGK
jgi:phage shock protein PspC (stress-responsive transcriptional regulator)